MPQTKAQAKVKKKKTRLPGPLFVVLMTVFNELMLYFWVPGPFEIGQLVQVLLFALSFGTVLGCIASFFGRGKAAAVLLSLLVTVLCGLEFFIHDAYQCFMTFQTVLAGADGIATGFASVVASLILRNLWRIALMLLPIFLYAVGGRSRRFRPGKRMLMATAAFLLYALSLFAVEQFAVDAAKLRDAYNFNTAVRSFGLNMGLTLDLINSVSGQEDGDFVTVTPTEEPPEEAPTEGGSLPHETVPEETAAPTEPPITYGENVMDFNFAALAEDESQAAVAKIHSYVASLKPSSQNEYTGLFAGKNLILISAEAFSAEAIDPELTPTLYRLATEGIEFTDYYQPAWGGSTSTGEYSNLVGLVPADGIESIKESVQQDLFLTIGNQLQALGYHSAAYHNHSYTYYDRHKTHVNFGYDTFTGMRNGMEAGVKDQWPESDLEMMEFTVQQYIDKQPFSVYYMTVSGHALYNQPGNNMARKNYDVVADMDASEAIKCYISTQLELEYAMESLVRQLEEAGIADDTVIVLATDHYPYGLEKSSTWGNDEDYLAELYGYAYSNVIQRDHSALIIWSGCIEGENIQVDDPVYSLDILPTLSNLFGVDYDSRLLIGRDVFSDAEALVLWPDYSWKTDKGTYVSGRFTPAEGVEVSEDYVETICAAVKNKITYSKSVAEKDYFNYLAELMG